MAQSNTVIIGAGIIGLSTAYYLSESQQTPASTIHLIEASPELFASASGYAAGFIAADWFSTPTAELGALSFGLHKELADKHDGRNAWGYSPSTGVSLDQGAQSGFVGGHDWLFEGGSRADVKVLHQFWAEHEGPVWLAKKQGHRVQKLSDGDSTAQVDPKRLCDFLLSAVKQRGVHLHQPAQVISVSKDLRGELASVRIAQDSSEELDLPCTRLVIAAGAWSGRVFSSLFPSAPSALPVEWLAGHSLVLRSPRWTADNEAKGCHAVFTTDTDGFSPEVFSRIGSEIYLAGLNNQSLEPAENPGKSQPDPADIARLKRVAQGLMGSSVDKDDLTVVREGLCFRPLCSGRPPLVCRLPDNILGDTTTRPGGDGGVFVAVGHGPWGISLSLGTGKVMSELIEGRQPSADVSLLGL